VYKDYAAVDVVAAAQDVHVFQPEQVTQFKAGLQPLH
jgi:hypothetical protein